MKFSGLLSVTLVLLVVEELASRIVGYNCQKE